jgi:hypothetical protein
MISLLTQAVAHSIVVVATVEAVRKRVPFDGWIVLVVAGAVSLALSALFLPAASLPELLEGLRVAVLAWLVAVGGDAWVTKLLAGRAVGFSAEEAPTRKEGPR